MQRGLVGKIIKIFEAKGCQLLVCKCIASLCFCTLVHQFVRHVIPVALDTLFSVWDYLRMLLNFWKGHEDAVAQPEAA